MSISIKYVWIGLVSVMMLVGVASSALGQATVSTDKENYACGDTVIITGTGWFPLEVVSLTIYADSIGVPRAVLSAVADSDGNIVNSEFVIGEEDYDTGFLLRAEGQTSDLSAETTFYDGAFIKRVTVDPQSTSPVIPGGTAYYDVTVYSSTSGNWCLCSYTVGLEVITPLPPSVTYSFSPSSVNTCTSSCSATSTLTLETSATTPCGLISFTVRACGPSLEYCGDWAVRGGSLRVGFGGEAIISGTKFDDVNGNGVRDTWEPGLSKWMILLNPGGLATLTDDNGDFSFNDLEPNTYTVTEVPKPNWVQTCPPLPGSYVVELAPCQPLGGRDFGNSKLRDYRDLSVSVAGGRARPGFQKYYGITYQNKGTLTVNPTLTLSLPPEVSHLESSDGGTYSIQNHNVTWTVGSLAPGSTGWLRTRVQLPTTIPLGTTLTSTAQIVPLGSDVNPADNTDSESQVVTGSYDPNDKGVTPEGFILCSDTLTYQVNFQNVGTDTAFNIVVRDTLDMNLDITTLENGASLHPNVFQIAGRELSWRFTNIQLPDSNVSEPESHGFVTFKVRPMPDLTVGTQIENHAGVYFDFNPPVITDTVLNTIIEALPAIVDADPNALNINSEGKYVTCYIELPEGYDPWDIDMDTVLFDGSLPAAAVPTAVADYDTDGVADRMVKFSRSGMISLLSESEGSRWWLEERGGDTAPLRHGEEFEVTVSGELTDGKPFLGTDVIRVINPGGGSDGAGALEVYPSPLNKAATIRFELPREGLVTLRVYDVAGRLVRRLVEVQKKAGRHEVIWDRRTDDGRQVSAGVYFVRLQRQGGAIVEKVLVVR